MRRISILLGMLLLSFSPLTAQADDILLPATMSAIYSDPAPAFGNPYGVTIVEFYDYQCGYCKASEEGIEKLMQEDHNIRLILMDVPKLGPMSVEAATATLASLRQGGDKYIMFHTMLMNKDFHLNEDSLFQAAKYAGLDIARLRSDMRDDSIARQIQYNIELGKSAGVRVTPSFIIGNHFFPGYAQYGQLKQMVGYVRTAGR